jgi:hypothetical protein
MVEIVGTMLSEPSGSVEVSVHWNATAVTTLSEPASKIGLICWIEKRGPRTKLFKIPTHSSASAVAPVAHGAPGAQEVPLLA